VAAVYSKLLGARLDPIAGVTLLGAPPSGTKWIVKDIAVCNDTPSGGDLGGFAIQDGLGIIIFAQLQPWVALNGYYDWHGSQVIEFTDSLNFLSLDYIAWSVRISGYELTTP
jgi:hypothetical protein